MTDFVGWLPMPDGGAAERALTADYNAEMIEQIARFPSLRDRAVFVGNPGDVVPDAFGDGLPLIRDWAERHFQFSGYVPACLTASATGKRCVPSSATGPVSRSASSRLAARVSGPACCAGRRRRSLPPAASSPGCGWSS